ncbi:hypothetical protein [Nocardia gamkensis]|uniref:Uncharacterized protein n=1 Tax=Nocardia gamkensis TaxID=352869 RepID=A0A7X6L6F7_9NOCA|nr:hypothetical protein [Nocardia gamkensis]NKY28549.1 hypothetical protein [Nocardia gamkensis]NQE69062.1 hypothetical protein [Nocardia gamkensis]
MIALFIGALVTAPVIYFGITYWPQRIPPERTAAAIKRRIDCERKSRSVRRGSRDTHGR